MSGILEINVSLVRKNIETIKSKTKSKFCAVVKANAYGAGIELAKHIEDIVDYFAVACVMEANELSSLTQKPILILSPPTIEDINKIESNNICFAVDNVALVQKLAKQHKKYVVHLACNTGMNRYGASQKDFCKILDIIKKSNNISLAGVFSHFYACGKYSKEQTKQFEKFVIETKKRFSNVIFHIANSQNTDYAFDMVRVGIGLYGKNQEALSLCSKIIEIRNIKKGEVVSYDANFVAKKNTKIAVVPLGYADGICRTMTGKNVLVCGKMCQIIGSVCMDCFVIDVSKVHTKVGDVVTIFGKDAKNTISVCQIAQWCDTISYEILSRLGRRIQRKYICKLSGENIRAES